MDFPFLTMNTTPLIQLNWGGAAQGLDDWAPAVRILIFLTLITFTPLALLMMTGFTRIAIVLSFLRQAIGSPNLPPTQILLGLALFMTYFSMSNTLEHIYQNAVDPYLNQQITTKEALNRIQEPLREFMIHQTREKDIKLFWNLSHKNTPTSIEGLPFSVLIPSFIVSELQSAFQIGFMIYLPFIALDLIVSSVLMSMGMMMLPPVVVSLPLKLIVFVLVDGWTLLVQSLIGSFGRGAL